MRLADRGTNAQAYEAVGRIVIVSRVSGREPRMALLWVIVGVSLLVGTMIEAKHFGRVTTIGAIVTALIAGVIPELEPSRRRTQWALVVLSTSVLSVILGCLGRMVFHALASR